MAEKMDEKPNANAAGGGDGGMMEFLYDRHTGRVCGRTGLSWLKITIFYIIFYASLAAFWALLLAIFYQTLDTHEPKWKLDESRIGNNPGLGYKPRPPTENIESTLINLSSEDLRKHYVKDLQNFIDTYKNSSDGSHVEDEPNCNGDGKGRNKDKYCQFQADKADEGGECSSKNQFGYLDKRPCVVIKLNRIYDWEPENYDEAPEELAKFLKENGKTFEKNLIYITCQGQDATSKESLLSVKYLHDGISFNYFPFRNQPGYKSPFIWVKFDNFAAGTVIFVECKAWANNIKHNRIERKGTVSFELLS